jgi:hypothetical protein
MMSLPSYSEAVSAFTPPILLKALEFVGPHLDGHSLAQCSRVSKAWNTTFGKFLWENPTRVFLEKPAPFSKSKINSSKLQI